MSTKRTTKPKPKAKKKVVKLTIPAAVLAPVFAPVLDELRDAEHVDLVVETDAGKVEVPVSRSALRRLWEYFGRL